MSKKCEDKSRPLDLAVRMPSVILAKAEARLQGIKRAVGGEKNQGCRSRQQAPELWRWGANEKLDSSWMQGRMGPERILGDEGGMGMFEGRGKSAECGKST